MLSIDSARPRPPQLRITGWARGTGRGGRPAPTKLLLVVSSERRSAVGTITLAARSRYTSGVFGLTAEHPFRRLVQACAGARSVTPSVAQPANPDKRDHSKDDGAEDEDQAEEQKEQDALHVMHPLPPVRRRAGGRRGGRPSRFPVTGSLRRNAGPRAWAATAAADPYGKALPRRPRPPAPDPCRRRQAVTRASSGTRDGHVTRVEPRMDLLPSSWRDHFAAILLNPESDRDPMTPPRRCTRCHR